MPSNAMESPNAIEGLAVKRAREMLHLSLEAFLAYGGSSVLSVVGEAFFTEENTYFIQNTRQRRCAEQQIKLAVQALSEYDKRAILEVVNDVICGKQSNEEACLVAGVNGEDFKEEDDIGAECELNAAKYKGAMFRSDELTGQPEMDCNMHSNEAIPEYDTTSDESGPDYDIGSVKCGLEYDMGSDEYGLDCDTGSDKFETAAGPDQNTTSNPNMSTEEHTTAEDQEGFEASRRVISPKIRGGEEVKNHDTKSDEPTHEAKVSDMRSDDSRTLAEPNKTTKTSENDNKPAATGESTNYVATTPKAPGTVVIKDEGKGQGLGGTRMGGTSPPIVDLVSSNSSPSMRKKKRPTSGTFALGPIAKKPK